jgi:hypothetical protein
LFELQCDLLLYDVTSTYFEGEMEGCPLALRGYSRDSRGDRPQVCIGLVVTEDGIPLGHELFAGNTHDSTTVKTIIESLEEQYGSLNRVWVMDRGMVSEANLKFLRERGGQYIVSTPKAMLRDFNVDGRLELSQFGNEFRPPCIVFAKRNREEEPVLTSTMRRRPPSPCWSNPKLPATMWKTRAGWMRGAGLGDAPRTLLHDLAKIKRGDIILPAQADDGV